MCVCASVRVQSKPIEERASAQYDDGSQLRAEEQVWERARVCVCGGKRRVWVKVDPPPREKRRKRAAWKEGRTTTALDSSNGNNTQ